MPVWLRLKLARLGISSLWTAELYHFRADGEATPVRVDYALD